MLDLLKEGVRVHLVHEAGHAAGVLGGERERGEQEQGQGAAEHGQIPSRLAQEGGGEMHSPDDAEGWESDAQRQRWCGQSSEDQRCVQREMAGVEQRGGKGGSLREDERVDVGWGGRRWCRGFGTGEILIEYGAAVV